ncbi:MAG: hypothetical protein H7177_00720 [Rhizobacter sp.]|nr:hypothetical protein [Bacteriovorax sp.]
MKAMIISILFILLAPSQQSFAEEKSRYYETYKVTTLIPPYKYEAMIYEPKIEKIKAILIISHTLSASDSIEGADAQYFSKNGFVVIVPFLFETELNKLFPDTEKLDADFLRPIASVNNFIDIAETKLKLRPNLPIFAMGASQGAITTITLTASITRIRAAWSAVGGGDLPHIFARSDVSTLVKFRNNHMSILQINNLDEYENYLRDHLTNDPTIFCKDIKVPFHQTIATHDTAVPTRTQELLAKECPPHEIQRLNLSHTGGSMTVVRDQEKIKEFFEAEL